MLRTSALFSSVLLALTLIVPSAAHAKKVRFTVDSTPVPEGRISINGEYQGVAPIDLTMHLPKDGVIVITAEREGAIGAWPKKIAVKSLRGIVNVRLEKDEAYDSTVSDQIANT